MNHNKAVCDIPPVQELFSACVGEILKNPRPTRAAQGSNARELHPLRLLVMEESSSSSCSDGKATGSRRFTPKQKAILSAHFNAGMRGVGELYASRIDCVAREAGLQVDQVKVVHGVLFVQ